MRPARRVQLTSSRFLLSHHQLGVRGRLGLLGRPAQCPAMNGKHHLERGAKVAVGRAAGLETHADDQLLPAHSCDCTSVQCVGRIFCRSFLYPAGLKLSPTDPLAPLEGRTCRDCIQAVYAPHAKLRGLVTAAPAPVDLPTPVAPYRPAKATKPRRPSLDWATLHQHTFGNDVLRCPCGGRRTIKALFSTHKAAEERLLELGHRLPSRLLPSSPAPPQVRFDV